MNDDKDRDEQPRRFDASIAEAKAGVARLIEPHALRGAGGVMTVALIELGIERHLDRFPDEKGARDLVNGVLTKVLTRIIQRGAVRSHDAAGRGVVVCGVEDADIGV